MRSICSLLSSYPLLTGELGIVAPAAITTARKLHYAVIDRKLTQENQDAVRPYLKKLSFRQTYWEVIDSKKIQALVSILASTDRLIDTTPCYMFSDGFFSHEPIYSALLAFGPQAPSLIGIGNNVVRNIVRDTFSGIRSPGNLPGIPLFKKSLQAAYEDWKDLLRPEGFVVKFGHAGKDKMGRLKVKNVAGYVLFDTSEEKTIMSTLLALKDRKLKQGKRKEREPDQPLSLEEDEERKKRRRRLGYGMLALQAPPISGSSLAEDSTDVPMDDPFA
jgi:hypothetical protein